MLRDNLISWWSMDETSGNRSDSHGSNTLTDNATVGYDTGKKSNCASFTVADSDSLSRSVGTGDNLNITGDMTIAFWMKHHASDPNDSNDDVMNRYGSSGNTAWRILLSDNGIYFFHHDGTTQRTPHISFAPTQNTWHYYIFDVKTSSSTLTLYVDDTSRGTGTIGSSTRSSDKPLIMGKWSEGTSNNLDGDLDEVAIWNRSLTSGERTSLYNSGNGLDYAGTAPAATFTPRASFFM